MVLEAQNPRQSKGVPFSCPPVIAFLLAAF